ncbi:AAA family ATPase, partial [Alistipes communis]
DVSSLVAGTKFRGEFEERMQQLLDELRKADDTIIFIDEIHTIVGAGSTQGSLDTANILKPALARGELQTIGATTLDEYRENIEKDSALERRFQRVLVEPTSCEETLQILRNIAPRYEAHHKVRYTDEALEACVTLTNRYITDRFFPDKAIDVLDEAGSRMHLQTAREPDTLREMEAALASTCEERREAVRQLVYEKAAAARLRELALRSKLDESRAEWQRSLESHPAEIRAEHIAQVITSATGIPIERITTGELGRLRGLKDYLAGRVIGQDAAVEKVALSIQRSRAGLKDENRPIGVFLFVGPTGVGKTLLAKELSKWLFDERRGLIRIDMSEYGEKHNVSRLIGSPPGYVGYGEGGQLTEAVRRQPYAVVLFDEIEKAHPEVFNAMLQIFDEGHLTDGSGRKVDFRNTVIIMTSNVGSRAAVQRAVQVGYSTSSKTVVEQAAPQIEYRKALERTFAPEFLNRIDDIIVFRTLTLEDVERIVELELRRLLARTQRLGYKVEISAEAKRRLAVMGYEARYGVRSLKRTLLDNVEEPLSTLIIEGRVNEGAKVKILPAKAGVTLKVA